MDVKNRIIEVLETNGISVEINESHDFSMLNEMVDSIIFISIIISLENAFDIEISENFLDIEILSSLNALCDLIEMLLKEKAKEEKLT